MATRPKILTRSLDSSLAFAQVLLSQDTELSLRQIRLLTRLGITVSHFCALSRDGSPTICRYILVASFCTVQRAEGHVRGGTRAFLPSIYPPQPRLVQIKAQIRPALFGGLSDPKRPIRSLCVRERVSGI